MSPIEPSSYDGALLPVAMKLGRFTADQLSSSASSQTAGVSTTWLASVEGRRLVRRAGTGYEVDAERAEQRLSALGL